MSLLFSSLLLTGFSPLSPIAPAYETCKKPAFCSSLPLCQICLNLAPGSNAVGIVGQSGRQTPGLLKAHANTRCSAFLSSGQSGDAPVNPTCPSLPARGPEWEPGQGCRRVHRFSLCCASCRHQRCFMLGGKPLFPGSLAGEGPALRPHRATDHLQPWGAELRFQEAAGCAGVLLALHHL